MSLDFQPGSKVGDYVLDAYVGSGSFGVVWRGHAEGENEPVAVKILTGALAESETNPMRADVELLAAAAASRSAHVVKVLGGGVEPVPYIVMEFIQGTDLQALLRDQGRLSNQQTIQVGLAVSDALSALYQAGIIHRDIKPANVMIDQEGVIKLADFGIAKIVGYGTVSTTGQTAMTMAYAAPEIWDENGRFGRPSHRSDLYAMGILLYQCLTGATPFSGNYGDLYKGHTERAPDITALPPETPASLRILIGRCLAKRQEDRPRDAVACTGLLKRAEVELAEASGEALNEPRRLGPWVKDRPHESVPWAWHCHNEQTGASATVEVHFTDRLDFGEQLAEIVAANARLAALGVERLLGSSRLLLYPNEAWRAAPPGEFQFWLAREDLSVTTASLVTEPMLRGVVRALADLLEAASGTHMPLDLRRGNLTVTPSGGIYLRRPGLGEAEIDASASAYACLLALPLDQHAQGLLDSAPDFPSLVEKIGAYSEEATVIVDRIQGVPGEATTIVTRRPTAEERGQATVQVAREQESGVLTAAQASMAKTDTREPAAATIRAELKQLSSTTRFGAARYQLVLQNRTQRDLTARLTAQTAEARVSLPSAIELGPTASQTVGVLVRPRKRRWWGSSLQRSFAISVTDDESGQVEVCQATFGDESYNVLIAAAGSLAILLFVALIAFASGGGNGTAAAGIRARNNLDNYQFAAALSDFNEAIERDAANPSYFYGRGRAQLNLGNLEAAATDADKAIALDSGSAEAYHVRSLVYDWQEHREEALNAATKAIELNPRSASYYAHRSRLYGERDPDKQWADASKALELDANSADAHRALGFAYRIQKRYPDAEAEYAKAIALDPKNGLRYANRASLYFAMDDYERALSSLDEDGDIIDSYPLSSAEGHWVRGATYVSQGKYREALREITKAVELVPLAPSFYDWRGYCYYLLDDNGAAAADLNKAIELAPSFADPYYVRSLLLRDQEQLESALQDINKAIALDPTDANYHGALAVLYWRLDNYPAAIAEATRTIQLNPNHSEAYNVRSLARGEQGQYNDALADASKAIELKPDSAQFYANRGSLYIDVKNYQAAVADLNKAISMEASNASFYNSRGVAYSGMDNYEAAIADYSRAIQNNATVFQYYMNRGMAAEELQRKAEARADYEKAKSLASTPEQAQRAQAAIDSLGR
ncbi:MAG TPA: tetratricopeptide repeat protein [Dehalococcoidia bacterium]|nr:tetratricopeptide repeat protein [Dehalococcoidia bacterium]